MFKLFINNMQVGNYKNYKEMVKSAMMVYCNGKNVQSIRNDGYKMFVKISD